MQYFRSEIKIGVLVFVSFSLLLLLVLSIGSFQLFQNTKDFIVYFNFADGLEINAPVRYSGVAIGKVKNICIVNKKDRIKEVNQRVKVVLRVLARVELDRNIKASVNTLGLMGEKYIELSPGNDNKCDSSNFIKDGDYIVGEDPIQIKELLEIGKKIVKKLEHTVSAIDSVLGDEETKKAIKNAVLGANKVVENLGSFTYNINEIVVSNRKSIDDIIKNVDNAASYLEKLMNNTSLIIKENRPDIKLIISNLKDTSKYAKSFAKKIEKSPSSLVWKSRAERKKELKAKREKAKEGNIIDEKGREVSARVEQFRNRRRR